MVGDLVGPLGQQATEPPRVIEQRDEHPGAEAARVRLSCRSVRAQSLRQGSKVDHGPSPPQAAAVGKGQKKPRGGDATGLVFKEGVHSGFTAPPSHDQPSYGAPHQ